MKKADQHLHPIYAAVATTASGKDTVQDAVLAIVGTRMGFIPRHTTRSLRPRDHYHHTTREQIATWESQQMVLSRVYLYGADYVTLRHEHDGVLETRPAVAHYTLDTALFYRELGYTVKLSRLTAVNQRDDQVPERVRERAVVDAARQHEHESDAYDGPDLVNDFSLVTLTRFRDQFDEPIPLGAVRAACQWLRFIAQAEDWDSAFLGHIEESR